MRHMLKVKGLRDSPLHAFALDSLSSVEAILCSVPYVCMTTVVLLASIALHCLQRRKAELAPMCS
jgi:hypothetical protein